MLRPTTYTRGALYFIFLASGASALVFQAGWQRILSLHAGMDLFSVTTVVAAFMAGLGVGSLVGGWLADRLRPPAAVLAYALAELGIGAFGWASVLLLYERYPAFSAYIDTAPRAFIFHFALLALPTGLMGMTLPLLARGVVERAADIAPGVGRLYSVNTLGAALGAAAMAGGWILGRVGLDVAIYGAATLSLLCGGAALTLPRLVSAGTDAERHGSTDVAREGSVVWWMVVYAVTGFVALGLEVVWFRLLNVVGTSTTYTFSRLLVVYLVGLGLGALAGGPAAVRSRRPERVVLGIQWTIGLLALLGPIVVVLYFSAAGGRLPLVPRNFVAPLVVLLPPTFLMGLSFPFMQRLVARRLDTLGRRVGWLLFSNTVGSVAGTVATGFLLLHFLGTPATLRVLAALACALGLAAAIVDRRPVIAAGAVAGYAAAALALPSGPAFWAPLHGAPPAAVTVHEDGSCVLAMIEAPRGQHNLYIAGERQNGVPFDDFHVRLGVAPVLLHPEPRRVLVIGLGAGSTAFGLASDPRVESVVLVEICAGELALLKGLAARQAPELRRLFADRRIRYRFQDGRKYLLDTAERFDLIVTDTLLTVSAFSGNVYSREFYELARSRLAPGGAFAQWVASERTLRTAASVFPHVAIVHSPELPPGEAALFVASDRPITVEPATLLRRLEVTDRQGLPSDTVERLRRFIASAEARRPAGASKSIHDLNRDLFPRDEYAGR